jgi:hypothetical protein
MVTTVINANSFIVTTGGLVTTTGLTPGVNFLSATPGALTTTPPTTPGYIEKPLLIATGTTSGLFVNWRGKVIPTPTPTSGSWTAVGVDTQMVTRQNYEVTADAVLTLPVTCAQFDIMEVVGYKAKFTIAQNAGQTIVFNSDTTTIGSGTIASDFDNSSLRIMCTVADLEFMIISSQGLNFTTT